MTLTLIDLIVILAVVGVAAYLVSEYRKAKARRPTAKAIVHAALKPSPPPEPDHVEDLKALLAKPKRSRRR